MSTLSFPHPEKLTLNMHAPPNPCAKSPPAVQTRAMGTQPGRAVSCAARGRKTGDRNAQQPHRFVLALFSAGNKSGRSAARCLNAPLFKSPPPSVSACLPTRSATEELPKRQPHAAAAAHTKSNCAFDVPDLPRISRAKPQFIPLRSNSLQPLDRGNVGFKFKVSQVLYCARGVAR